MVSEIFNAREFRLDSHLNTSRQATAEEAPEFILWERIHKETVSIINASGKTPGSFRLEDKVRLEVAVFQPDVE